MATAVTKSVSSQTSVLTVDAGARKGNDRFLDPDSGHVLVKDAVPRHASWQKTATRSPVFKIADIGGFDHRSASGGEIDGGGRISHRPEPSAGVPLSPMKFHRKRDGRCSSCW
jgi:hypothetical protein